MQRQLQDLRKVEVPGKDAGLFPERTRLHAAAAPSATRILCRLTDPQLLLDYHFGVEQRGKSVAAPDHLQRTRQYAVRCLAGQQEVRARLQQVHLLDHVQQQIRHLVRTVGCVGKQSAETDVGEVGVGAALGRRDSDFRRRRVVVELDEQRLEQFSRRLAGEAPLVEAALEERSEVLVQVPWAERVPAVELRYHPEMTEPVRLECLVKIPGGLGRDTPAHLRNVPKLPPAVRVGLRSGHLLRQFRVSLGEADRGIAGDLHRPQSVAPGGRFRIQVIQPRQRDRDFALHLVQAAAVDLVVQDRVARGTLLHELREHSRLVQAVPLLGQRLEQVLPH